jgi:hypothetical protein
MNPVITIVVQPTGDRAEATTPTGALLAARTLMREARDHGAGAPTAAFYVDGSLVRQAAYTL